MKRKSTSKLEKTKKNEEDIYKFDISNDEGKTKKEKIEEKKKPVKKEEKVEKKTKTTKAKKTEIKSKSTKKKENVNIKATEEQKQKSPDEIRKEMMNKLQHSIWNK